MSQTTIKRLVWGGLMLWAFWLSAEYLVFGPMSYVRIHDTGDAIIPSRLARALERGGPAFSYWFPWAVTGADYLSAWGPPQIQDGAFWILPTWLAFGLIVFAQRAVAACGTYLLLTRSFQLGVWPSIFGAAAYALFHQPIIDSRTGFHMVEGFALPGLAFILWALERMNADADRRRYLASFGLGLAVSMTSHYVLSMFVIVLVFYWFLAVRPQFAAGFWMCVALFVAGFLVYLIPTVWASVLHAPLSQRAHWPLVSPLDADNLAAAAAMTRQNAVYLLLLAAGTVFSRQRRGSLLALGGFALLCIGLTAGYRTFRQAMAPHLGFLVGFQFDRINLQLPFACVAGAALALESLPASWRVGIPWRGGLRMRVAVRAILIAGLMVWIGGQSVAMKRVTRREINKVGATTAAVYANPEMKALAARQQAAQPFRVAVIPDPLLHPGFAWAYGLETVDGYVCLYPKRFHSFWEEVQRPLISVDTNRFNYFHYWGSRVYLTQPSQGFVLGADIRFADYYRLELLSLANTRYIISHFPISHPDLTLLPSSCREDLLRRQPQPAQEAAGSRDRKLRLPLPLYIYENQQAFPRFFVAEQVKLFDNSQQVLEAMRRASHAELRTTAYLERTDAVPLQSVKLGNGDGSVSVQTYTADRIALDAESSAAGVLVNATSYNPFWKAWIDGRPAKVFPVDHTFQGIVLPAGRHRVVFEYDPPYALRLSSMKKDGQP